MRRNLLIAEGNAELRDLYQGYFSRHDFTVDTASDGLSCLEKLRWATPSVLVLDRELLWGGAEGVLALLHENRALENVQVVLTSATPLNQEWKSSRCAQIVNWLVKPFPLASLLECVRGVTGEKKAGGPALEGLPGSTMAPDNHPDTQEDGP